MSSVTYSSRSKVSSASTIDDSSFSMVAAIDIGTSTSGYAYCYRRELEESRENVILNPLWHNADKTISAYKTPTSLLLNEKREFEAFGYEAEKKYLDLFHQGRHERCFFFRRYKTKIYGIQNLTHSHILKDETGKSIPTVKVLSLSIRYLKGHMLNTLRMRGRDVATEDIKWMITVPSFWSDAAKQFMRQAAVQAGIPGERIKLALEPECASVFCQNIPHIKGTARLPITIGGAKYALADIGGGTTDIIIHEKRSDGHLKELNKGGGCIMGSGHVDNAFLQFLVRVIGAPVVREFIDVCKIEFLELLRDFELAKSKVKPRQYSSLEVKIPPSLDRICKQKQNGDSLANVISKTIYREKVKVHDNKICIDGSVSSEFFRTVSLDIAKNIKNALSNNAGKGTNFLVLVGGFASSPVVQEIIKRELEDTTDVQRIIVAPDPELAILKGAVMFGHQPKSIFSRVIRYTYGLRKAKLFNPDMHPNEHRVTLHGIEFITDVFSTFITSGTRAPVGFVSYDSLTTIEPFQKIIEIDIYYSTELNPKFVTDQNCWVLGKIDYQIPNPSREERTIYIEFIFGDTELVMNITDRKTASRFKNTFPTIEK